MPEPDQLKENIQTANMWDLGQYIETRELRRRGRPRRKRGGGSTLLALTAGTFESRVREIWADRVGEYLSASDRKRHIWHAWLSADNGDRDKRSDPQIQDFLLHTSDRGIIADGYGVNPPGIGRALGRFGIRASEPHVYRALVALLSLGGAAAKYIQHSDNLRDQELLDLVSASERMRSPAIIAALRRYDLSTDMLSPLEWVLGRLQTLTGQDAAPKVLASRKPMRALQQEIERLEMPAAPLSFDGPLHPITSAAELRTASSRFANCLRDESQFWSAVLNVQNGINYFYEWRGDEPGLLRLTRVGGVGWVISEALGRKNIDLSGETQVEILKHVSTVPEICPSWPTVSVLPIFDSI